MTHCVSLTRALDSEPNALLMDKACSALGPLTRSKPQDALLCLQNDGVLQRALPDTNLHNPNYNLIQAYWKGLNAVRVMAAKIFPSNVGSVVDRANKLSCKQNVSEICNNNPLFIHLLKNQYGN